MAQHSPTADTAAEATPDPAVNPTTAPAVDATAAPAEALPADMTIDATADGTGDATGGVAARRHVHEFNVRFGDIDMLGHVNNCRYLGYLEDARVAMLRLNPSRDGRESLQGLVVARHEIDYRRPLLFRAEPVRVESWVAEMRAAWFAIAYEIRDDEHVYATARSVLVAYDLKNSRARRLTDAETAFLTTYL